MQQFKRIVGTLLVALPVMYSSTLSAEGKGRAYEVTITNITKGEIFTPIMVAAHPAGVKLFHTGEPASEALEMLAEGGDTGPLSEYLADAGAIDVVTTDNVLPPGMSVTAHVRTSHRNNRVSVAAMLVPTNDAFFAINGVKGPRLHRSKTLTSPAYDAGTEHNDEMCVSIPGPPFICAGEGYSDAGGRLCLHSPGHTRHR